MEPQEDVTSQVIFNIRNIKILVMVILHMNLKVIMWKC